MLRVTTSSAQPWRFTGTRSSSGRPTSGAAYVYSPDGLGGRDEVKLTPSDAPAGEDFGRSVAVSSGAIVVGDPFDDAAGFQSGAAYVFLPDGSGGYDRVKLAASDGAASDWFGRSVAVSGDSIVVGAPRDDAAGIPVRVGLRVHPGWSRRVRGDEADGTGHGARRQLRRGGGGVGRDHRCRVSE